MPPPLVMFLQVWFLLALQLSLSHSLSSVTETQLIPSGFSCTQDMPRQTGIYSTPPNSNLIKVDLIHILCGQISSSISSGNGSTESSSTRVGGFHARPGNVDPASASTANSKLIRPPPNVYGYAVYKYPYVYDSRRGAYVVKNTGSISSIWPTVLSMEDIAKIITNLVYLCQYVECFLYTCNTYGKLEIAGSNSVQGNSASSLENMTAIKHTYHLPLSLHAVRKL